MRLISISQDRFCQPQLSPGIPRTSETGRLLAPTLREADLNAPVCCQGAKQISSFLKMQQRLEMTVTIVSPTEGNVNGITLHDTAVNSHDKAPCASKILHSRGPSPFPTFPLPAACPQEEMSGLSLR